MKTIKILGGGISGLTAAINLGKAGFNVEVYERKSYCGKHEKDFQFLENWTYDENVLDFLKRINIKKDFYVKPFRSFEVYSPSSKRYIGKSSKPLLYLVKRGHSKDSIGASLARQAKNNNVKIIYNSKLDYKKADIIATGPKKLTWIALGIKFRCKYPDKAVVFLDNNLSSEAYSYFISNDNMGEITCCNPIKIKNIKNRLNLTIKKIEKILDLKVRNIKERFAAGVNFNLVDKAKINNQYFVGEGAGFQDNFYGFGMVYAFKSGYCAAKSIIENKDYDKLWKKSFLKQLKISDRNRSLYKRLSNDRFERFVEMLNNKNFIVRKFLGGDDFRLILKKFYNKSFPLLLKPLLY